MRGGIWENPRASLRGSERIVRCELLHCEL